MSSDIVKYAFIAGELSSTLHGRTDLTKFDLGMAEAKNFFVDYRGGLSSRPGTRFTEFVKEDGQETRFEEFSFSSDVEDNHVMLFGHYYVRILQNGNYVLKTQVACTVSAGVVTATAHSIPADNWIKAGGRTYRVSSVTPNTFEIYHLPDGALATDAAFTTYQEVYEVVTPYAGSDLAGLSFDQYRDRVRITSLDFAPRDLTRNDTTNWVLSTVSISPSAVGPTVTGESLSDTGTAETVFAVTKVLADGTESVEGEWYRLDSAVNYPITEGSVSIQWAAATDAIYYNVYRSIVSGGTTAQTLSLGSELGYLGKTYGTKFTDPNIIPDFGRTPPRIYNPFAAGAIRSITVTAGGSGYTSPPAVAATGGGSGLVARAIINDSGAVVNVVILDGGSGYTSPGVTFSGGGGSGATATAVASPATGVYPALSTIFQQRQIFACSVEYPVTIWGSQSKRFENFNSSELVLDTDSFEFDLDTSAINPIKHILPTRGGLLVLTQENVWLVNGGDNNQPITPTSAIADPQTYTGVSELKPIRIGPNILYTEGKGYAVRELSYNEISRVYSGVDRTVLSSHLFGFDKTITSWAYQESPYKVVWSIRSDGALLAFTTVGEEEVFAWTPCETQGKFLDVVSSREGNEDRVYLMTQRFIDGRWSKFVEQMDLRQFVNVEDAWCVDCGLSLDGTTSAGSLTVFYDGTTYTAQVTGGSLTGSVDKILRAGNGIWRVSEEINASTVELELYQEPTNWVPETGNAYTYEMPTGTWTLDAEVSSLSGLWHLEGEEVSILADGNVLPRQTVTNGAITLTSPASRVTVGLRFTCRAKTLPLIVPQAGIEAKRKRIVAVAVRLYNSRALKVGDSYETLYSFPERTNEQPGRPIALQNGIKQMPIGSTWDEEAHTFFELSDPLPATLLSLVQDVEVGDEPD